MAIRTDAYLKTRYEEGDQPDEDDFKDLVDSKWSKTESIPISSVTFGWQALTVQPSGAIAWDVSVLGTNVTATLNNACALTVTNALPGQVLMMMVTQDVTGGRTLSLPVGSKVGYGGGGAVGLTTTAGAIDIITGIVSPSGVIFWLINQNFT